MTYIWNQERGTFLISATMFAIWFYVLPRGFIIVLAIANVLVAKSYSNARTGSEIQTLIGVFIVGFAIWFRADTNGCQLREAYRSLTRRMKALAAGAKEKRDMKSACEQIAPRD
jgi:hypothetical protein